MSVGAIIAAALGLGLAAHGSLGITCYAPHALIGVRLVDVRRVAMDR